jgi:xanthine dehydrogenase accessory factor
MPEFAGVERSEAPFDEVSARLPYGPNLHVLVMTPEHGHDLAVLRGAIDHEWRWLGALGSRRKTAEFRAQLQAAGAAEQRLAKLRMPVGVEIGSESPDEIAVSIAAELIALHSRKTKAGS